MVDVENCLHSIQHHLQELQEITERRYLEGISEENARLTEDYALALQLQAEFTSDLVADEIETLNVDESEEHVECSEDSPGKESTPEPMHDPSNSTSRQEEVDSDVDHRLNALDAAHDARMLEILQRIDRISAFLRAPNEVIQEQCATSSAMCGRVDELTRSYNTVIEALNSSLNQQFNENQSVRGDLQELRDMVQSLRLEVANASGDNKDRDSVQNVDATPRAEGSKHGYKPARNVPPAPSRVPSGTGTSQLQSSKASPTTRAAITPRSQRTRSDRNLPPIPDLANGGYPVRVDPIRFGRSTNYDAMARKIVKLVYHPSGLSARLRGYREGPTTLLLMWKAEVDARTFFEAWHEVDHEDDWADVSVSLDFLI